MDFREELPKEQFIDIENGLIVNAPAKINLSLLIAGKRPDGFHEIETIMSKISWYDQIIIEPNDNKGLELVCKGDNWAPQDDSNLVLKAARLIEREIGEKLDLKLTLVKNIPAGTGLGSASSDAASTFMGINKFLQLGIEEQTLSELAAEIGSDIPFFIGSNLAYCTGRGEKITKIAKNFDYHALVITPNISIATADVYKNYKHNQEEYLRLSDFIHPNIQKKNVEIIAKMCANMLQQSCYELNNDLARLTRDVTSMGIEKLCLSGSGSALYILFYNSDTTLAKEYQQQLYGRFCCQSVIVYNNRW